MYPTLTSKDHGVIIQDKDHTIYIACREALARGEPLIMVGKGPGAAAQCVREAQEKRDRKAAAKAELLADAKSIHENLKRQRKRHTIRTQSVLP